jgi:hypothetical protein
MKRAKRRAFGLLQRWAYRTLTLETDRELVRLAAIGSAAFNRAVRAEAEKRTGTGGMMCYEAGNEHWTGSPEAALSYARMAGDTLVSAGYDPSLGCFRLCTAEIIDPDRPQTRLPWPYHPIITAPACETPQGFSSSSRPGP